MIYTTPDWAYTMAQDFEAAKSSIVVTALSMHPPHPSIRSPHTVLIESLYKAAARGVRVRVWLGAPHASHPACALNEATRRALLARGIECRLVSGGRLLHAKTAIVDMASCWIGSGNFTSAAMHSNHECYAAFTSAESARRWVSYLEAIA